MQKQLKEKRLEKKVDNMIDVSLSSLKNMLDADSVVGKPITTLSGNQIIPVSKLTVGYLSGGGEYGEAPKLFEDGQNKFAGGAGAVVSIKPTAFLIDDGVSCRLVNVPSEPIEKLFHSAVDFINGLNDK